MTHPDRRRRGRAIRKSRRILKSWGTAIDEVSAVFSRIGVQAAQVNLATMTLIKLGNEEHERAARSVAYLIPTDYFEDVTRPTVAELKGVRDDWGSVEA